MDNITVLFCITGLNKGGAEKSLYSICTRTGAFHPGFKPIVVSLIGGYYEEGLKKSGITCIALAGSRSFSTIAKNTVRLVKLLRENRKSIQVIHGFMPHGCVLGMVCRIIIRKPLIYAVRVSVLDVGRTDTFYRKYIRAFFHWVSIHVSQLITVNAPHVVEIIEKKYGKKAVVVMNGIEPPSENVLNDISVKQQYFNRTTGLNVVSVCNMRYPQKDIPGLLNVAALDDTIQYILVGDGPDLGMFKKIAQEKKLKNVEFTGFKQNVLPFLHYADLFICLTRFEGFPNTVLEAMACKCPVIMSDIPEVKGILDNDAHVLLVKNDDPVDVYNAILKIRKEEFFRISLITNSNRLISGELSMEVFIKNNFNVYLNYFIDAK